MATFRKRGAKWQATVRRKGYPAQVKSFFLKDDAAKWARQQELRLDKGIIEPQSAIADAPLEDLLSKYEAEVTPKKRSRASEAVHLLQIKRHAITKLPVRNIRAQHVAQFRDDRLKSVSSPTVRKELTLLGSIFALAIREWGLIGVSNPTQEVKKPPNGLARERRLNTGEQERFDIALSECRNREVISAVQFARSTAMRRSEILSLSWNDVDLVGGLANLTMTKNGLPRSVPLCPRAREILEQKLPQKSEVNVSSKIFPISPNALRLAFDRVCDRANIKDFHFHDLRHEAISRFFELGFTVPEVALISGHRDARMLFRYTHLKPSCVSLKLANLSDQSTKYFVNKLEQS